MRTWQGFSVSMDRFLACFVSALFRPCFLVYSGGWGMEPFPLSVRYALGCKFLIWGVENQPIEVD